MMNRIIFMFIIITFQGASRNEEFYTLPFNLNRFFPPS
ncbi:BnaCnng38010D [Brassica napus]|uniref:(rape) hypothetical protein n=1 Tax=Brassica napus TaxID=3708 RepID=A0A078J986_BRANA|nr:unnamed protein product [Brassica napus]CDY61568.1 BnaCnng38010D [Brassica napus]